MRYRRFGRKGWQVSEVGYGMWGLAGWSGTDEREVAQALQRSVELGCNFFDTAWAYGQGASEKVLGSLLRDNPGVRLFTATKVPPKNFSWPAKDEFRLDDCYPPEHIEEYVDKSLKNAGIECFDLMQLHTWNDDWVADMRWREKLLELRKKGKIDAIGISLNRWEPNNGLQALETGIVDAVQVVYNIFDQNPEDNLFPLCKKLDVAVIARVPFDEGTLTGTLTESSSWPKEDWRSSYFVPSNLIPSVDRANKLKPLVPPDSTMPDMALRFILEHQCVSTVIPGMRKISHVEANCVASERGRLPVDLASELKRHRWERTPNTSKVGG